MSRELHAAIRVLRTVRGPKMRRWRETFSALDDAIWPTVINQTRKTMNKRNFGNGLARRDFIRTSAVGLTALSASRVFGANERINVGLIGFGLIGRFHLAALKAQPDVQVTAVCDVHKGRVEQAAEMAGTHPARYGDFRKLLGDKNVDAVWVTTPDHWHALMTMMACAAGKDVYVEKPTTLFVREGRWMVDVAHRTQRVIQVGTQNRSGPPFQRARELLRQGKLGAIVSASNNNSRNVLPGFGNPPDQSPPPELDYDLSSLFKQPSPAGRALWDACGDDARFSPERREPRTLRKTAYRRENGRGHAGADDHAARAAL